MAKRTLYYGGPVITMEEPLYADALLVKGGKIEAVGSFDELKGLIASLPVDDARQVEYRDLKGCTLLPAFLDPHSHFSQYASSLLQIPLDETESIPEIQDRIREFIRGNHTAPGQWLIARGYDHNLLAKNRHLTRWDLDEAAPSNPLLVQHRSGHLGVFNTLALDELGVTPQTPSPSGGLIGVKDGELTGYMEENAFMEYLKKAPSPSLDDLTGAFQKVQDRYASYGITTIQDGMIVDQMVPLYKMLLGNHLLKLDLVGYPGAENSQKFMKEFSHCIKTYQSRFKIGGYKIFLDGSPQGRTAWMRAPYLPDSSGQTDYCGYGTMSDEAVLAAVRMAADQGLQLLAHCNGDAAAEQYLCAFETAYKESGTASPKEFTAPLRPVIIHAQLIGADQLARAAELGLIPSFFIAHVYYWGDTHIRNFGMERASAISPASSAKALDIPYTFHQDSPVLEPNMLETVWCAVNRLTRSGIPLGPDQRISALDALKGVTINAAYQYFEEDRKGSLAPGKLADLVILGDNPLEVSPEAIRHIPVIETIKEGETIYRNPDF